VTVKARLLDELGTGLRATLYYRVDGRTTFTQQAMADDGAHGDGLANDGIFAAQIPTQSDKAVMEFYVEARDAGDRVRTWPAPANVEGVLQQTANALYQVDSSFDPQAAWVAGSQPIYSLIMTDKERTELALIGKRSNGEEDSDAQIIGCAIHRLAGQTPADASAVQVRVNGANLASTGSPMYGVYVGLEAFDDQFAESHFPDDPHGNLYTCFRTDGTSVEAELRHEGDNPDTYRNRYFKANNQSEDDWSDLIHMVDVLNNAPEATYIHEVNQVINIPQWLRYIAIDSLLGNYETVLNMGIGDDYFLYRGVEDPRFVLIPHDLDTILWEGNSRGAIDQSIFSIIKGVAKYDGVEGLKRLFNPEIIPLYYQAFRDLIQDCFNPEQLDPLFDQTLGGFTPKARIDSMKQSVRNRTTAVLAQIPQSLTTPTGQ
jgi:hypothetical protein